MMPLAAIVSRAPLAWTAALAAAAAAMLVPANLLPVMSMYVPGRAAGDTTIFAGIVSLYERGMWGLAAIVFTASIAVPFAKLFGIAILLTAAQRGAGPHARLLTKLYNTLNLIGRWSMLDVFLVALFSGLVQFGAFGTVEPRPGIGAFAVAVVLTMLSMQAFDPHLLWMRRRGGVERSAA